ncbi:MAG: bifunctional 4-hydroxy-2-oxoglutarate aldolase/2-dehydro-3-deoxy-phosphogluconate aldolase [Sphingobacteriales bacterium]|nr:MAG: bifunctional 4-hydroxy-2-oxoglutarate aldolase/2-dehydro-3-deoxy-phosphogluconate aldolase [Sphingobacteriales bacterium]
MVAQGSLPLYYYDDAEVSLQIMRTLYKAGIRVFEYTNRGSLALDNFIAMKKLQQAEMPDLHLGIGTIKTVDQAETFISAGADFVVAPVMNPAVGKIVHRHNLLWIPGCLSTTEIFNAQENGAALIKIFPGGMLGPKYISSIRDLFPGQLFIPTGGVDITKESIVEWFRAGVCAVGLGSNFISKNVLDNQLYDQLYNDTVLVTELIQSCK